MVDFFGPEELLHPPAPPCPIHPHPSAGHTQHREGSTGRMIPAGPRAGGKGGDRGGPARRGRCCSSGPPPVAPRGPDPAAAQARSSPCLRPGAARPRSRPGPGAFPGGSRVGLKPPSPSDPQPGWGCCTSIPLRDQRPPPPCTSAISGGKKQAACREQGGLGEGLQPPQHPAQPGSEGSRGR